MTPDELQCRSKEFALRVIRLSRALPSRRESGVISTQLLRSATSVGANYRACCRARSRAEFVHKMSICIEEADEAGYWLELIIDAGLMPASRVEPLLDEANQLTAIFNASRASARRKPK